MSVCVCHQWFGHDASSECFIISDIFNLEPCQHGARHFHGTASWWSGACSSTYNVLCVEGKRVQVRKPMGLCLCALLLLWQVLDLAGNDLNAEAAPEVAKCLESFPALRRLVLSENELQDEGTTIIAAALPGATRWEDSPLLSVASGSVACSARNRSCMLCDLQPGAKVLGRRKGVLCHKHEKRGVSFQGQASAPWGQLPMRLWCLSD